MIEDFLEFAGWLLLLVLGVAAALAGMGGLFYFGIFMVVSLLHGALGNALVGLAAVGGSFLILALACYGVRELD